MIRHNQVVKSIAGHAFWRTLVRHIGFFLASLAGKDFIIQTKMPAGSTIGKEDPRRPNKIFRYKPLTNKPTDDPIPEYMNLLGMIFSMCGLLMKVRLKTIKM